MDIQETLAAFQLDDSDANRLAAILQGFQDNLNTKDAELHNKELKIQALTLELAHLRRIRYGKKQEALSGIQRDLFEDSWNEDVAAVTEQVEQLTPAVAKPKRNRAGRQPLPEHLPRIEHHHEPDTCECGQCGRDLVKIRDDVTEQLDVEPARFFVHRHSRPQYACKHCETITAAPIPPAVIDGGMAAVGLLTWVMISKYLDHLPLYRLEQIAARHQVTLSRSTLADWVGRTGVALQPLDDYDGYKALFDNKRTTTPCIELGCWTHVRRKFFDLHQANASPMALEALKRIVLLYTVEQQGKHLDPVSRCQLRKEHSLPVLAALHNWLLATRSKTANGGSSAKALDYALKRWPSLIRYAQTSHLPIKNNPVENTIRPIALGKKNWLFAGSERAGRRAAAIQSLLGTAKLNGLDPAAWLKDTLEKLPAWPNSRIDELLPLTPESIQTIISK